MSKFVLMFGGICAAAACVLILASRKPAVDELAHKLEDAWADHHTTA